ncbi:hypothetical protein [Halorubrum halodurans]|uniref:hypothetical protein n=1 Tax=Halorubrum halodurans TaxID=1383851 RepID=UPI00117AA0F3|nr:hypothetical protein [Halorubrum halodurans]
MTSISYKTPDGEIVEEDNVEVDWEEDNHLYRVETGDEILKLPPNRVHVVEMDEDERLTGGGTVIDW